jgi:hypothetical protein
MQLTGMLHGCKLLRFVDFPAAEVLGPEASEDEIKAMIERHGSVFVKPIFKGGVGKKGKSGLIGRASDLKTALQEKERLYFVQHQVGNTRAKAQGVTFEAAVPAQHEVYFSISDSTRFRAPSITLTHMGGVAIEELGKEHLAEVPFEALTGLKAFVIANALTDIGAPREIISPLVQNLPKLWELFHHYGITTLELNPIRMSPGRGGRLVPVACDFKCGFDRDDPRRERLNLPASLFAGDYSDFELEINQLRTYQGAGRRGDHLLRLRRQSALPEDARRGADLLQVLARAVQRALHHRRQVEQHRHLRDPARLGRRAARALRGPRRDPALRRGRPRRAQPGARHGRAARYGGGARPAVPLLRVRLGHERSRELRARRRPLDESRRPRPGGEEHGLEELTCTAEA